MAPQPNGLPKRASHYRDGASAGLAWSTDWSGTVVSFAIQRPQRPGTKSRARTNLRKDCWEVLLCFDGRPVRAATVAIRYEALRGLVWREIQTLLAGGYIAQNGLTWRRMVDALNVASKRAAEKRDARAAREAEERALALRADLDRILSEVLDGYGADGPMVDAIEVTQDRPWNPLDGMVESAIIPKSIRHRAGNQFIDADKVLSPVFGSFAHGIVMPSVIGACLRATMDIAIGAREASPQIRTLTCLGADVGARSALFYHHRHGRLRIGMPYAMPVDSDHQTNNPD